ncbi:uncharacterized protein LOC131026078 [Salvia miltiorrhiza]|uniref:uncharacterized protein LOC131026078 n=1 Tax=Salvia miltiorrhiza TaxID=226208 RepID=UPI0025AB8CD0|nr:uncharacterized protein LOC131026078 [Salvia miltiorrhiza]
MVFLMETKLLTEEWLPILGQCGFNNFVDVDCDVTSGGRRGGLCLLWADDVLILVNSSSLHHIHATVSVSTHNSWDFCGIYGWSNTEEHVLTWELLKDLHSRIMGKWMCGGDFNETILSAFRDVIHECGLEDLGFSGIPYTWTNNQKGEDNIMERLDRLWDLGAAVSTVEDLHQKIQAMGPELKIWEKREFGHIKKRCGAIREQLADLQQPHREPHTKTEQRALENELDDLLQKEEIMWRQRSRAVWMAEGDRNFGFFHKVAEGRKKRN